MTVVFESLLKSVARAFYPDQCVLLIDVLIRDKYLRDDADMSTRLKLPLKELRRHLQHLMQEQLVRKERVDDLEEGGSRATEFFYIDYYHALQVITYRLHLLKKGLESREKAARGTGAYECPNHARGLCEGRYTSLEAQSCYDDDLGTFVCAACRAENMQSLTPMPKESYALVPVDDRGEEAKALRDIDRVKVQLGASTDASGEVLRRGVHELLQQVNLSTSALSSNLRGGSRARGRLRRSRRSATLGRGRTPTNEPTPTKPGAAPTCCT